MQLTGFEGRIAFVTGAAGGIGRALVRQLLAAGSTVVATDLAAPALAPEPDSPGRLLAFSLDVSVGEAVTGLVQRIEAEVGPIALGVNVAGVLGGSLVAETSDAEWRRVFAVNCDGVFHVGRALAQVMQPRGQGAIVTVGSNAAGVPRHAMAAYAASKAAATMFTRCLGLELAPHGIRCNIVAPGSTLTPMQTGMWADEHGAERVIAGLPEQYKAGIPLRKLATPEDIAHAVMFLLSEQAGHIAMSDLYVDGGATLRA
jgi:2,3-dihydro-2,3-dihydroxybenzoate dehydrogenase